MIKRVITKVFQDALDEATDPWGVKAERVEMSVAVLVVVLLIVILIASIIIITVLIVIEKSSTVKIGRPSK